VSEERERAHRAQLEETLKHIVASAEFAAKARDAAERGLKPDAENGESYA
jgi:hypothetical protein